MLHPHIPHMHAFIPAPSPLPSFCAVPYANAPLHRHPPGKYLLEAVNPSIEINDLSWVMDCWLNKEDNPDLKIAAWRQLVHATIERVVFEMLCLELRQCRIANFASPSKCRMIESPLSSHQSAFPRKCSP